MHRTTRLNQSENYLYKNGGYGQQHTSSNQIPINIQTVYEHSDILPYTLTIFV